MSRGGGVDVRHFLQAVLSFVKSKANHICTAPCDGFVLKMHYRWTFFTLLGTFLVVWHKWFSEDISCVSHNTGQPPERPYYLNACYSYPFLEEEEDRRYLMFYRWIPYTLLLLAGIYYIPRKLSKNLENPRAKKLLEDVAQHSWNYETAERQLVDRVVRYMTINLQTHNGLYIKYFILNLLALIVDILCFRAIDFLLQGRFALLGYDSYPYDRDGNLHQDYLSMTFPPFVMCEIGVHKKIMGQRTERYGCYLALMEMYEKIFLFLWFWMIFLMAVTIAYMVFLLLMYCPAVRRYLLRTSKPITASDKISKILRDLSINCKIGDIYYLYRLKTHFSHARFYEILTRLSEPELCKVVAERGKNAKDAKDGKGGGKDEKTDFSDITKGTLKHPKEVSQGMYPRQAMNQGMHPTQGMHPRQGVPPNHAIHPSQGMHPSLLMHPSQGMHPNHAMHPSQGMPPRQGMHPDQSISAAHPLNPIQHVPPTAPQPQPQAPAQQQHPALRNRAPQHAVVNPSNLMQPPSQTATNQNV